MYSREFEHCHVTVNCSNPDKCKGTIDMKAKVGF